MVQWRRVPHILGHGLCATARAEDAWSVAVQTGGVRIEQATIILLISTFICLCSVAK